MTTRTTPATGPADAPPATPPAPPTVGTSPHGSHRATSSLAPTARHLWFRSRGLLLAAVVVLAAAVVLAAVRSGAQHGRLDPRSADPLGSRAVAALLGDRGVSTRVVTSAAQARAAADPDTTLLVADPDLLTDRQRAQLRSATEHSGGRTVLVAPSAVSVGDLVPGVFADAAPSLGSTLAPRCTLPAARRAGPADTGGIRYNTSATGSDSCYPSDGLPSLVRVPAADPADGTADGTAGDTIVLGAPDILFNDRLDRQGNASLALQLLGSRPHLVWYLPSPGDHAATGTERRSFYDLIPSGWLWGTVELGIAALLAAAWRARRLGPLVLERLPVVIRASETTEGLARLYRRAGARDRAADALRAASRTRLAPLVGVPPAQAHSPEALIPALTTRVRTHSPLSPESPASSTFPTTPVSPASPVHTGRAAADSTTAGPVPADSVTGPVARHERHRPHLRTLLFGPPPSDDAALAALAEHLDALEGEVRRS